MAAALGFCVVGSLAPRITGTTVHVMVADLLVGKAEPAKRQARGYIGRYQYWLDDPSPQKLQSQRALRRGKTKDDEEVQPGFLRVSEESREPLLLFGAAALSISCWCHHCYADTDAMGFRFHLILWMEPSFATEGTRCIGGAARAD